MERGVEAPSEPQSRTRTADTHLKTGATDEPRDNQQVSLHVLSQRQIIPNLLFQFPDWSMMYFVLRLQHEVSLLQQQLCESRDLIHSLQSELQVYDRVCARTKINKG